MNWKTIETVSIVNSEGESENIQIQHNGNFYKIRNEFGNMSFDFDISSGRILKTVFVMKMTFSRSLIFLKA